MRLFFALWPDDDTRQQLRDRAALVDLDAAARRVPPQNYHLTLAFLGEIGASDLARVRQIAVAKQEPVCSVVFDRCEYWESSRVVVAAARATPAALADLSARLQQELALLFPGDPRFATARPLRAHVTLARKVSQAPVRQDMSPFEWQPTVIALVRSETGAAHTVYTVVDMWPLLYASPSPPNSP